jgi:hypothetical protein
MKKKFSKILGVALTVALLTSLVVAAVPTTAKPLGLTPELTMTNLVDNTVVAGINIADVAANGDVVYAATDNSDLPLYKSLDAGATWADLSTSTLFPSGRSVKAVAVAPDNPDIVAILTSGANGDQISYSTNGGAFWTGLGSPTNSATTNATLYSIDVSSGTTSYICAGGELSGAPVMYSIRLAIAQSWGERYGSGSGQTPTQTRILAARFSPNFSVDKGIAVVSSNASSAAFQLFRHEMGDMNWNGDIGYLDATDWGTGVILDNNITTISGTLDAAEIAFPASYLANNEGERLAYIALGDDAGGGGVLRLTDIVDKGFQTWSGGSLDACGSLSYHEAGKVIAGSWEDNKVYQFMEPNATQPRASRPNNLKQPGGTNKTSVAWCGDVALAGTQGTHSAIATSSDDGYTFNDVGLISETIAAYTDLAVSADGSKLYVATNDGTDGSIWLKEGNFKRVLTLAGADTIMLRLAPEDDSAIYAADFGTTDIWVSKNSGLESWNKVSCYTLGPGDTIQDMAVESADTAYILDDDGVTKTSNSGASYGPQKRPVDSFTPFMITMAPNGDVLVGGTNGYFAYSKDGGSTFERAVGAIGASGNTQVVADDGYTDNNIVYIASGSGVWRGKSVSAGPPPAGRGPSIDSTMAIRGITQYQGVTYVLTANGTDSALYKALNLEAAATSTLALWSDIQTTADFGVLRQAMKMSVSGTTPKLWAIAPPGFWSIMDPIAVTGPTMVGPADGVSVEVNPASGQAFDVNFVFERYNSTDITQAEIEIATDSAFEGIIYTGQIDTTDLSGNTIARAIGPTGALGVGNVRASFMPGNTYYWRVRTTEPIYSPWSEGRSFTVASFETFVVTGPETGAVDVSLMPTFTWAEYPDAIGYEIMLSEDPTFAIIEWSYNVYNPFYKVEEELKYSTTYYWRVRGVTGEPYLEGRTWITPAGPWITGIFTTMAEPVPDEPDVITITEPGETKVEVIKVPVSEPQAIPTYILWVIVGVGAILVIALIVLIVRTRRVA